MVMRLYSVRGNIVELSPLLSEVCVLWLRGGFNERFVTWMQIAERFGEQLPRQLQSPWREPHDTLFALNPPAGILRWLLVFSNPDESKGFRSLDEVRDAVRRSLDRLSELHAQSISFIHIPSTHNNQDPIDAENLESATAMIQAASQWVNEHETLDKNIYMIDRDGDFSRVQGMPVLEINLG
jgi:hypothetical protein